MSKIILIFSLMYFFFNTAWSQNLAQEGWPLALKEAYDHAIKTKKNYVLLVSRLPSLVLDYRTNNSLRDSLNRFEATRGFDIGHAMIGWHCTIDQIPYTTLVGFSGESNNQHEDMLKSGWGLTSLLADFKDGFLQSPQDLQQRFESFNEEFTKNPKDGSYLIATMFEITPIDCEEIVNEFFDYSSHEKEPLNHFGFLNDPDSFQGAGCGSFANHFLKKVAAFKNIDTLFYRHYQIPYYLFGKGQETPEDVGIPQSIVALNSQKPVYRLNLLSLDWSPDKHRNISMKMIDPELVLLWQKQFFNLKPTKMLPYDLSNDLPNNKVLKSKLNRSVWTKSNDFYGLAPSSFTLSTIDEKYDEKSSQVVSHAKEIMVNGRWKPSTFKFFNFPGVIWERK
ncbi:MAG: hypothetical protein L6Q37_06460 [Bdellovibrionaceae bacterium]|nr:hypothetical protein [Pseudobdellovibrionaceae bacterium]NUM57764.1 hypothetical protein [Pseudobdellovibrionaceae bacterium]